MEPNASCSDQVSVLRTILAYQLVQLDAWLLPLLDVSLGMQEPWCGERVMTTSTEAAAYYFVRPRASRYRGRRLFLTIIRRRLPFQS